MIMSHIWFTRGCVLPGLVAALLVASQVVVAQSGQVKGRVTDAKTGEALPGANVIVVSTTVGASTDLDGRYTLRNVPQGTQLLKVTYIGYLDKSVGVTVVDGETVEQDFTLTQEAIEGEEVVVTAQAQGQNAAINQQLSSNTITSIVSRDRIKDIPDVNAAESVGRLPGVSINRSGGEATTVTIRGLEPKYNLVTVNGVRLPSSGDDRNTSLLSSVVNNQTAPGTVRFGGNDRSVDLSLIASNALDGIEVKKSITPDMDADALGGTIDLKLREAPPGLQFAIAGQGGYNQLQNYYGNYNFSVNTSNRFLGDDLGVILSVNADHYDRSADKFTGNYTRYPGSDSLNYIQNFNMREEKGIRERTGGNLLLDYSIPFGKVNGSVLFNKLRSKAIYRVNNYNLEDRRHYYDLEDRHGTTDVFALSVGAKQDYGWIQFDAGLSRNGSESESPDERAYHFSHEAAAYNLMGRMPNDPSLTPADVVPMAIYDTSHTLFADGYRFDTRRNEYQTTVQMNVSSPFRVGDIFSGYVKAGGKFRQLDRRNDEDVRGIDGRQYGAGITLTTLVATLSRMYPNDWNFQRDSALISVRQGLPITPFLYGYSRDNFLNGQYPLGFAVDPGKTNQLMEAMMQLPGVLYQRYVIQSLGRDYTGVERYQAAYAMADMNIGDYITLLPGIRWEKDYSTYTGQRFRQPTGNPDVPPPELESLVANRKNEYWLPMIHLTLKPIDWLKVRMAFTKSIARPGYNLYTPITYISSDQKSIVAANADLKPSVSKNFDAAVSVFDNSIGLLTLSGFYKEINDLIFSSRYNIAPSQFLDPPPGSNIPDSWTSSSPTIYSYPMNNKSPGYVRGVELEWQTHFWYLPGVLKGLVLNVNYTRSGSNVDIHYFVFRDSIIRPVPRIVKKIPVDTSSASRVQGQPANILNVTLGYDFEGFSARLSYLFQSDRVAGINATDPSLSSLNRPYERWDLTLQQSLFDWGVQVYANFANINARPDEAELDYQYYHPTFLEYYGFTMDIGFRFTL